MTSPFLSNAKYSNMLLLCNYNSHSWVLIIVGHVWSGQFHLLGFLYDWILPTGWGQGPSGGGLPFTALLIRLYSLRSSGTLVTHGTAASPPPSYRWETHMADSCLRGWTPTAHHRDFELIKRVSVMGVTGSPAGWLRVWRVRSFLVISLHWSLQHQPSFVIPWSNQAH